MKTLLCLRKFTGAVITALALCAFSSVLPLFAYDKLTTAEMRGA